MKNIIIQNLKRKRIYSIYNELLDQRIVYISRTKQFMTQD